MPGPNRIELAHRRLLDKVLSREPLSRHIEDLEALRTTPAAYLAQRPITLFTGYSTRPMAYMMAAMLALVWTMIGTSARPVGAEEVKLTLVLLIVLAFSIFLDGRRMKLTLEGVERWHWNTSTILPWDLFAADRELRDEPTGLWMPIRPDRRHRIRQRQGIGIAVPLTVEDDEVQYQGGYKVDPLEMAKLILEIAPALADESHSEPPMSQSTS